jgi:AcrR family transcriptional regulator
MMKEYIMGAFFLMMEKKEYGGISIGEITAKAGVNRSTYYRNFDSKEDIVKFFVIKIWREYMLVFDKTVPFKEHLKKLLTNYIEYKREFLLIYKHGLTYLILDVLNDLFKPVSEDKSLTFEERHRIYWYAGAIYNVFLLWLSTGMRESPAKLGALSADLIPNAEDRNFLTRPFAL